MKKIIYSFLMAFYVLLYTQNAHAQLSRYLGQPYGDLFSNQSGTVVYGTSHNEFNYGARSSLIARIEIGAYSIYASDSLDLLIQQKEKNKEILYGTAIRYNGPQQLRSYIFKYDSAVGDIAILKASAVSATGTYSIQAMVGNSLYGVRTGGGNFGYGVFFKINKDGTGYTELYHFDGLSKRPEKLAVRYDDGNPDGTALSFWGITATGGTHGKGALLNISLDGSEFYISIDFTGQGGSPNEYGPTDGEGPVGIIQDTDTDFFLITRAGGTNNQGAIFQIGLDGFSKIFDFNATYGTPSGNMVLDKPNRILYGVGAEGPASKGFLWTYNVATEVVNDHLVGFNPPNNNNLISAPIALVMKDNSVYGTASHGGSPDRAFGTMYYLDETSSIGIHASQVYYYNNGYLQLTGPADGATDVSINTILQAPPNQPRATVYKFLLSETADFSSSVVQFTVPTGAPRTNVQPPRLKYSTTYWVRISTDLSFYGPRTSFTTSSAEKNSFVTSPMNGAMNVATNNLKVTANVVYGATSYTIELNTSADFTGISFVKSSDVANQRTLTFNGLAPGTTYYNRTKTNLPSDWGPVRSFTTDPAPPPSEISEAVTVVKVYPNPFVQSFTAEVRDIENETGSITLLDLTGRQLYQGEINNNESVQLGGDLKQGMYILRYSSKNQSSMHRVLKQ